MRTFKLLLPLLGLVAVLAGCGGGGSAKLASNDVAVVGDQHVTKSEFDRLLGEAKSSYQSQGRKFPKQGTTEYETVKGQAVSLLVQQAARESKAASMGIKISDADVTKRLDQIKKQYFAGSEAKYKQQLKKQHLTEAALRADIKSQLVSEALFSKVTNDVKVSDKEVDAYYKSHSSLYSQPASRDVRYILVGKDKATAQSVYQQLKNGNDKTWCTLAKKYAKDASGQNCGKATFTKGQTVPVFDNAAFSTPTNTIHKPFFDPTQYKAWFVVEPLGPVKAKSTTPEKQVAPTIRQTLLQQDKNQKMSDWVTSTMKSFCGGSKIKYAVGYQAIPDPCAQTSTTTNSTTTG